MSSVKLRELIKQVRACKTAAEERALVQREKAQIRESFNKNEEAYRPRNVAKLLFINMLGHDTEFGQMECLKLITANTFTEKRIGYLGLTQLFHEKSEVLMMATNRIHYDLDPKANIYIISLALIALSEICTTEMVRDLVADVLKILEEGSAFVKKKAALAAIKIIKKLPETIDDFVAKIDILMEDRHHGVLLSTLGLIEEILVESPQQKEKFKKYVNPMVRILKGLVSGYSAEFDISGVSDPFLQIQILKFFRQICTGSQQLSEEVQDILAQVATNTSKAKNTGNAVLFECVKTIMSIESASTLKTLGINILGNFLSLKDNNSKYVSLFMLQKVLNHDIQAVQKHKGTILECLKENDRSIKQLALDLIYLISNDQNIKSVIKELVNYLLVVNDPDFVKELTMKICAIVDKHSPNRRWHIDTIIKVLTLAGNYIKEESTNSLIHLICSTPQLQTYAVHKLYFSLSENVNQEGLAKVALYSIGEFGTLLTQGKATTQDGQPIRVSEEEVVDLIVRVFERPKQSDTIKEYGLTALIKLYTKFKSQRPTIVNLIESLTTSTSLEVQKRACEYLKLIDQTWDKDRDGICEPIPEFKAAAEIFSNKPIGDINLDEYPQPAAQQQAQQLKAISLGANNNNNKQTDELIDLDDLIGGGTTVTSSVPIQQQPQNTNQGGNNFDLLGEIFSGSSQQQQQQPIQQQQQPIDLMNLYGNQQQQQQQKIIPQTIQQQPVQQNYQTTDLLFEDTSSAQVQPQQQQQQVQLTAFQDNNITILLNCVKESVDTTFITTNFNNKTANPVTDLVFQVAVLKHLKLTMNPINFNSIAPYTQGQTSQTMRVQNSKQGEKGIVMKMKIQYTLGGMKYANEATIQNFPQNW